MAIRHPVRWIAGLVAALILCAFLPQMPGCVMALSPKVGRVIDSDTGEGIPGAAVVAEGTFAQHGLWQGSEGCTYAVIAYTDKDGNYRLPGVFSHFSFGTPGANPRQWWEMNASRAGYVPSGTTLPLQFDNAGGLQTNIPPWDSRFESFSWAGYAVKIPPLQLKQANLSLQERAAYFLYTGVFAFQGCPTGEPSRSKMQVAIRTFYEEQRSFVCRAPPDETTNARTVEHLYGTSGNFHAFENRLRELVPRFVAIGRPVDNPPKEFRFWDLCEAMKAGDYK